MNRRWYETIIRDVDSLTVNGLRDHLVPAVPAGG